MDITFSVEIPSFYRLIILTCLFFTAYKYEITFLTFPCLGFTILFGISNKECGSLYFK